MTDRDVRALSDADLLDLYREFGGEHVLACDLARLVPIEVEAGRRGLI